MPTPIYNQFTQFEFSNEELFAATRLTQLQLMLLQSLIANCADHRLAIKHRLGDGNQEALAEEICERGSQEAYEYLFMLATTLEAPAAGTEKEKANLTQQQSNNSANPETSVI